MRRFENFFRAYEVVVKSVMHVRCYILVRNCDVIEENKGAQQRRLLALREIICEVFYLMRNEKSCTYIINKQLARIKHDLVIVIDVNYNWENIISGIDCNQQTVG